jgi:hypothetical protein
MHQQKDTDIDNVRLLKQQNEESQHVLVPESITIAQYLNREFQHQDYKNQKDMEELVTQSELKLINEYSAFELMKDQEGEMIRSIN